VKKITFFLSLTLLFWIGVAEATKKEAKKINQPVKKKITATSWVVVDEFGKILKGQDINDTHSIASITKLMTAMVILDANQNLDEKLENYTRRQLLLLSLVRSDNYASNLLCNYFIGGYDDCIKAMNFKASKLGMKDTIFVDASGLDEHNLSTASDLIKMVQAAQFYPLIVQSSSNKAVKIKGIIYRNTNPLINEKNKFLVSKTGWTRAAGGCLAIMTEKKKIAIVLNSRSVKTRIPEIQYLVKSYN